MSGGRQGYSNEVEPGEGVHTLCGVPMVNYVIEALKPLASERLLVVVGHQAELVEAVLPQDAETVLQREQLGTGDAVGVALEALGGEEEGVLLVVNGDGPLISERTLEELVERHRSAGGGRPCSWRSSTIQAVWDGSSRTPGWSRSSRSATPLRTDGDQARQPRSVRVQAIGDQGRRRQGGAENSQGELYLTDVLEIIGRRSRAVTYRLKNLEGQPRQRPLAARAGGRDPASPHPGRPHEKGVTVRDPDSTHIEASVEIGRDTVILPGTFLRGATIIGSDCVIGPSADLLDTVVADGARVEHSVGRGAEVGERAAVGPYAFLRPGTVLGPDAKVGAYCEVKNTRIGRGSKVPSPTSGTPNRGGRQRGGGHHHRQLRRRQQEQDHYRRRGFHGCQHEPYRTGYNRRGLHRCRV